jgi:hypothetical protein
MPRYFAESDERYPDWDLSPDADDWGSDYEIELTEAEYGDFCRVQREYEAWQKRIEAVVDANVAKRPKKPWTPPI